MNNKENITSVTEEISKLNEKLRKNMKSQITLPNGKTLKVGSKLLAEVVGIVNDFVFYTKIGHCVSTINVLDISEFEEYKEKSNYMVKYVIDDGYDQFNHVCIISAEDESSAYNIFRDEMKKTLTGERFVVDKYTEITKCEDDVILYNSRTSYKWKKKSIY